MWYEILPSAIIVTAVLWVPPIAQVGINWLCFNGKSYEACEFDTIVKGVRIVQVNAIERERPHGDLVRFRSSDHGDLVIPSISSSKYGQRKFAVMAGEIWNSLPVQLRDGSITDRRLFKKTLKHHYFNSVHQRKPF
ncbi:hypothetical protein HELRODRAFT_173168 [Helobdella robusta]|uniref:Uncharacterized protein n=1 Tax=Helobdella robusta TaxID=6412 RepID=T1F6H9_HELRO|nr:hypothetical protein HELRODRAFT_173168 [Helobdella robusta]ESO04091.1 hypothetical protein HELRODRAFT_173168 [Helobdella robusta]